MAVRKVTQRALTLAALFGAPTDGLWEKAACRGHRDPDLWFPATDAEYDKARAVCDSCPIQDACLATGMTAKEDGIWGGLLLDKGKPQSRAGCAGQPVHAAGLQQQSRSSPREPDAQRDHRRRQPRQAGVHRPGFAAYIRRVHSSDI